MLKQEYDNYTAENHEVWSLLYKKQMQQLEKGAAEAFHDGLHHTGFNENYIPRFTEVNQRLSALTGWKIHEVPGIVPDAVFFQFLSEKKFPATTWIRKMSQLEYLEEPDMFHDVFGHVPILSNQSYCDFLKGMADIALKHIDNAYAIELMSRLYWFTVEFGLIQEQDELKIYGAGLISSIGESEYSLHSAIPQRLVFDIDNILDSPYIKERFQVKYFIIENFEQLYNSLAQAEEKIEQRLTETNSH
jgi:phenylalanine-4-hydroxylase